MISSSGLSERDLNDFSSCGQRIPSYMFSGLINYINYGVLPGKFLQSVIANNLSYSVAYADDTNVYLLPVYVSFLHNEVPSDAWGSENKMKAWHESGGLLKLQKAS